MYIANRIYQEQLFLENFPLLNRSLSLKNLQLTKIKMVLLIYLNCSKRLHNFIVRILLFGLNNLPIKNQGLMYSLWRFCKESLTVAVKFTANMLLVVNVSTSSLRFFHLSNVW